MPGYQGLARLWSSLLGRQRTPSPAEAWLEERAKATPEAVIETHFAAMQAHDLDLLLATLSPERARLYAEPRTVDKRRLSIVETTVVSMTPADGAVPLPAYIHRYRSHLVFKVAYVMKLVEREQRRDPSLREGEDWAYYVLVTEGRGKPWLIADWGR